MKKLLIFLFLLCISFPLLSQHSKDGEDCTLEMKNFLVDPGVSYGFDIFITRNSDNWSALGHLVFMTEIYYSTLVFNYNGTALQNPIVSNLSSISSGINIDTTTSSILVIDLLDDGTVVPTSETLLLTVTFDVVVPGATAQLDWRLSDTAIIDESSNNFSYYNGTLELLGSDDSNLPATSEIEIVPDKFIHFTPNPFGSLNSTTQFFINTPEQGPMELNVFNIKGQLVKNLYKGFVQKHQEVTLSWDGKDSNNNDLFSGVYLYQLLINDKSYEIEKMAIIR